MGQVSEPLTRAVLPNLLEFGVHLLLKLNKSSFQFSSFLKIFIVIPHINRHIMGKHLQSLLQLL